MIRRGAVARGLVVLIERLRRLHRRPVVFFIYAGATAAAYACAYFIRFEFSWNPAYTRTFLLTLPLLLLVRNAAYRFFRLSRSRWRFVGISDVLRLTRAAVVGTLLFTVVTRLLTLTPYVPLSVVALEGVLTVIFTAGVWIGYRAIFERVRHRMADRGKAERRVMIIGAGESGYMLAREMLRSVTGYRPVAFVDDDPHKWGTRLAGLEVVGSTDEMAEYAERYEVEELVLAVPRATPSQMRSLVTKCASVGLPYRVLPNIAEVLAGNVRVDQIREVRIEDLLQREPVQLDLVELAEDLDGGCVLITGAAGSIGSELARQIAHHSPDLLLLLDQSETALFYLEMELRQQYPNLKMIPLVADVVDRSAIESIFMTYDPTHVFHAAAYKHVPMMERNVREAVRNNVLGSYVVADAAGRRGTGKFVLVSTDKAVRPRSVMGATKRLAEAVALELQDRYPRTIFAAVRFGNVLGSNGSVIPIFKQQIASGQPLTVTHPDVTRYFMTIPEAVQLILQASLLPEIRGHIAMLEMGEPVRIVELAENLLRLCGSSTEGRIVFTGLRPGEKLHEELVHPDEETIETEISKVRLIRAPSGIELSGGRWLDEYIEMVETGNEEELMARLGAMFPDLAVAPATVASGRSQVEVPTMRLARGA